MKYLPSRIESLTSSSDLDSLRLKGFTLKEYYLWQSINQEEGFEDNFSKKRADITGWHFIFHLASTDGGFIESESLTVPWSFIVVLTAR